MNMLPIFDGHNDTLLRLYLAGSKSEHTFFIQSDKGHIDLPRARKGGFGGGFFAVFVPPDQLVPRVTRYDRAKACIGYEIPIYPAIDTKYAQRVTNVVTASLFQLEAESKGQVKVVRAADELITCLNEGILAAILHFEGAEAIDPELDNLKIFYQEGLRSLGIVWSRPNAFAYGVPFRFPHSPDTGPGLTQAGQKLVRNCNRLGIMLDLSHLNERGFWDVARLSSKPLVATHSNAHSICPSTRNLTDRQLDAISETEGIVGLSFAVGELREDGRIDPDTPLDIVMRHMDYLVKHIGIDCVGIGSDFDGTTHGMRNEIVRRISGGK